MDLSAVDDTRYWRSREQGWQRDRAHELGELLACRGIPTWSGQLPPTLST